MGATAEFTIEDTAEVIASVYALTRDAGGDRVIEVTGLQSPLGLATELTAEAGKLIIAGYHQDRLRQVNMQLWNWRGLDVINSHERDPLIHVDGI